MNTAVQQRIPISKPSITQLEINYVNDAITNGWGSHCYDYIIRFQKLFASYLKSDYALATSSCTGAIHLAFLSIGLQPGDEVICPDITWIASVAPITYIGAKPVFVDVKKDTWCIDPEKIEQAITSRTKAIMPVHLYGNVCEMDEIMAIAKKYNLFVIEDAAEALGSEYKGKKVGSIGDFGAFSFHGTKTMTTSEGGMLVTNNKTLFDEALIYNDHGRDHRNPKTFWMERIGYKYKISNLQAALGCAQVERLEDLVNKKREIFNSYKTLLNGLPGLSMNAEQEYVKNSYWMPTIIFDEPVNFNRENLFAQMKEHNIDSRPFFYPLSFLPMFETKKENTVSYGIYDRGINLPSYYDITQKEIEKVVNVIKSKVK
ncbi:MAG: DegT/DnrJ/EryC1/StrS family aminotransferase [Bacteroidota bacterium]|nr:DegT/DnrJ/EryC1/StrS family aminotransferase [Bacteroidota bacterium]